jgi:hypothetical protein
MNEGGLADLGGLFAELLLGAVLSFDVCNAKQIQGFWRGVSMAQPSYRFGDVGWP